MDLLEADFPYIKDMKEDIELLVPGKSICRCCFSSDKRLKKVVDYYLPFYELIGVDVRLPSPFSGWVCVECTHRLSSAVAFRRKVLNAQNVFLLYLDTGADRTPEPLPPSLTHSGRIVTDSNVPLDGCEVLEHKQVTQSDLDIMKFEPGSDYEDSIPLEVYRSKLPEEFDDNSKFEPKEETDGETDKKKKRGRKKEREGREAKAKKKKDSPESFYRAMNTSEPDPSKIRIITLDPEQQMKERQEESSQQFAHSCQLCYKGFTFASKLENHMRKHSPSRGRFVCTVCHMHLPTRFSLSVHWLGHTRRYECVACGRRMLDKKSIMEHYRTQHEGFVSILTCDICGKQSTNSKTHHGHMRTYHAGAERPKCDVCGKTFVNKDSLEHHMQIHEGVKNYSCSQCGQRFRTRSQLTNHAATHKQDRDYYCVECDVRFKTAHTLRQHLKKNSKHRDRENFIHNCPTCTKSFDSAAALSRHEAVQHLGAREWRCRCGAALASRASLVKHTRAVHAGRRPPRDHVCHACGKAFRSKNILTNHMRTHTGEKPFPCALCGRRFAQRSAHATHVRAVHLKIRRGNKVKPEPEPVPEPPLEQKPVTWPSAPAPCQYTFTVTAGP